MAHNFENLSAHILSLSEADSFGEAKGEWELAHVELREEFDSCPCGKRIKELCYITNQLNDETTYVGNVCINQFVGIETGNLFAGLKRIVSDETANANADLIEHAYHLGYISRKEYGFLIDTRRKRNLSEKQLNWKRDINRRIIKKTVV